MNSKIKRCLTGIRASGNVHIGNYLGTIKPAIARQKDYECIYFIADMHALTNTKDAKFLREKSYDVTAVWLALGADTKKSTLFLQSDVPMVTEYAWYLSSITGMGLLEKSHAYKDSVANNKDVNHAIFSYPVLMAADILMYDVDIVPVGKDQKQHVEMARDMAGSFNATYQKDIIKLPLPVIDERVMLIPGLDGRKMSKSYNNEIPVFCEEVQLKKLIMSIKTDSSGLEDAKELKGSLVGDLYSHFSSAQELQDLSSRMQAGGMGWGHAKAELFEVINRELKEARQKYFEIRKDEKLLDQILSDGAERAFNIAHPILNRVREAVGFKSH